MSIGERRTKTIGATLRLEYIADQKIWEFFDGGATFSWWPFMERTEFIPIFYSGPSTLTLLILMPIYKEEE